MYIILEGIDKTGKTSLAKYLSTKLNLPVQGFSQPKEHPYVEYMRFLLTGPKLVILDRFYLGERAYGPVKRGKSELSDAEIRNIELSLMMANAFCIYTTAPANTIRENFIKEKENYTTFQDIVPLKNAYQQAMWNSRLKWHKFDYRNDGNYQKILALVKPWYEDMMNQYFRFSELTSTRVIGNPDAKTLLVGDICNTKLKANRDPNLVVPFAFGKSSEYLFKALDIAGIDPSTIAITNQVKYHDGRQDIFNEVSGLKNLKKIIYLGKRPRTGLPTFVDEITINHPSWAARFQFPIKKYAEILKKEII